MNASIMSTSPDRIRRNGEYNMYVAIIKLSKVARAIKENHPEKEYPECIEEACNRLYPIV